MADPVVVGDRVLVTTITTGTGTYDLGTAVAGYLAPADAGVASAARVAYVVVDSLTNPSTFEIGEGTYTAGSPATISRTLIVRNSSGGTSAISWSAGTKYIFLAPSASRFVTYDSDGGFSLNTHLTLASGAAASVAVSTPGDRDTGLFFPGPDRVALATGGVNRFEITAAGVVAMGAMAMLAQGGPEGGEMILEQAPDSTLNGNSVIIDQFLNGVRIFESGSPNRGVSLDLTQCSASVNSAIWHTGNLTPAAIGAAVAGAGTRNAVINGNFDIWQRGTSFTGFVDGAYTADRWVCIFDGSGATRTISRQSFTLGQTDVPNEPTYFLRFDQSVAGSGALANNITQRIESVRTFAGKTVSISFFAKAASPLTLPLIYLAQGFGSGGSPSAAATTTVASNISVGTSWTKYTYQVTVPSISGKTLGSDNNDYLTFEIMAPLNATFTLDVAQVQIEIGSVATEFERRPIGTELELCQRYYWKTFPLATTPAQNAGVTGAFGFGVLAANGNAAYSGASFPIRMRIAPTLTGFNPSAANAQARNTTNNADFSSTVFTANEWGFFFTATAGNWGVGSQSYIHLTATAEL
jgi:hypothetical protein